MSRSFIFDEIKERLSKNISLPLPGNIAHSRLAPQHRFPASFYLEKESDYRTACVMALLFPDEETKESRIILIERTGGDSVHAGQISFPGGKIESSDLSPLAAALRETEEEIGVSFGEIEVIGELSPLYIPPSKFLVHPFVGATNRKPAFHLNVAEVEKVLTPLLSLFADELNIKSADFNSARGNVVNAPYFEIESCKIWGATAMMISELIAIL